MPALNYTQWRAIFFNTPALVDPSVSAPGIDADLDGLPNLLEFALGRHPLIADAGGALTPDTIVDGGARYLTIQFRRNTGALGIEIHGDSSGELGNWNLDGSVQHGTPVNNGDGTETVTLRDTVPMTDHAQRFLRLRVIGNL